MFHFRKHFMLFLKTGWLIGWVCGIITCQAQQLFTPSAKVLDTLNQKGPILYTLLGNDSATRIPARQILQLIDSPLVVKDTKGRQYRVIRFDFGYLHVDTTFNDTTERFDLVPEYLGFTFVQNQLDSLWKTRVRKTLHAGERLYFDHIIAEDASGIKYGAPPLHILVVDSLRKINEAGAE
ncbi:MAG: hypothetical protein IRZ01_09030 [Thermoflavifilum aggregans]|nr:hypothetical protein [Thermoflavifilum aggregans]